jgi:hypothetical protein
MPGWGGSTANESKPKWEFLQQDNKLANTFADERGWVQRHPWGDEVLVAIGGLGTQLGVANLAGIYILNTTVSNVAAANIAVTLVFNEKVAVTAGVPTLTALGSNGAANVVLAYSSGLSDANIGKLVFSNTTVSLANATVVGGILTINSTSVATGWANVVDGVANTALANGVPSGFANTVRITAAS